MTNKMKRNGEGGDCGAEDETEEGTYMGGSVAKLLWLVSGR
jgi:hypothetical protein